MNKRTRNLLFLVGGIVLVIIIALLSAHRHGNAIPVRTLRVSYATFQSTIPESGTVQHPNTETVPTLVAGNLGALYVKAGQHVSAGQLLATITDPTAQSNAAGTQADYESAVANISSAKVNEQNAKVQYQAAVATAKSALDLAQKTYDADVNLYANKAIARQQLDTDSSKLQQAKVQYQQALEQLRLGAVSGYGQNSVQYAVAAAQKAKILNDQNQQQVGFTRIVAPFDGTIQSVATQASDATRTIQIGDAVTAGESLFTIAQGDRYVVQAQVDEQDIINIKVGQAANVTGEDFPNQTIPGHVTYISPIAVKSTDTSNTAKQILTTISLDRSPSFLKDGMTVDVDIVTQNVPRAIAVPSIAITKMGKTSSVFVVANGKAEKRTVTTGASNDAQTVVTSGLKPGDVIIADRADGVLPGSYVTPMPQASPTPAST